MSWYQYFGTCFILLATSLVTVKAVCVNPLSTKLPTGCSVRNLAIVDNMRNIISDAYVCNQTIEGTRLKNPPSLSFTHLPDNPNNKYLITAVNVTSKRLIWMVSNVTADKTNLVLTANGLRYRPVVVKDYVGASITYPTHEIEFLCFNETFVHNYNTVSELREGIYVVPFNLTTWIERQYVYNRLGLCGPVGGGNVVLTMNNSPPPNPNRPYPYVPPASDSSNNNNGSKKKNSAISCTPNIFHIISVLVISVCVLA